MDITELVRKNIRLLKPYATARDEFQGTGEVYLDANENPYPTSLNRYPDPLQKQLKENISRLKNIASENIFLGNGSDEAIDLLMRAFCEPYKQSIVITPPTYGMYQVSAGTNGVPVIEVPLDENFDISADRILSAVTENTRIIFLASPNNPTANLLNRDGIKRVIENFSGLVVVDEAYIDFSGAKSFLSELPHYPNLIVLQTFSKAWGLAAIRLGMCFAGTPIIAILNKIKFPYNINVLSQMAVLKAMENTTVVGEWVKDILSERADLRRRLDDLSCVLNVYPSDANFFLVKVRQGRQAYDWLLKQNIIVRDRSSTPGCADCLRITVGKKDENDRLVNALKEYEKSAIY